MQDLQKFYYKTLKNFIYQKQLIAMAKILFFNKIEKEIGLTSIVNIVFYKVN